MKTQMKYFLLALLSLCLSCSKVEQAELASLSHANSLLEDGRVDSALIVLENIPAGELTSAAAQARYALLLTQARDKNYIPHTNDSLIRIAVDYYDGTNDILSRAKAHYYLGRVYQDINDIEATVREFLSAMPLAEEVDDYELTCILQGNLGHLFWVNGLLEEADSLYKCALALAEEKQDTVRWALTLSNLSDVYLEQGEMQYAEVEGYLNQALSLMKNQKNISVKRTILFSLAFLYERMGKLPETISMVQRFTAIQPDTTKRYGAYSLIGSAYYKMEKYDSATFYLNKCLISDDFAIKEAAYMRLADMANAQGRIKDMLFYENKYQSYSDSVRLQKQPVEVTAISKDILHQQIVSTYRSSLDQYKYYLIIIAVILLSVVLFLFIKRLKEKRKAHLLYIESKKNRIRLQQLEQALLLKNSEIKLWEERYKESENYRDRQKQINSCLNELLEEKRLLNAENDKALKEQEIQIDKLKNNNFRDLIIQTDIFKKMQALKRSNKEKSEKNKLTEADWDDLEREFNLLIPHFLKQLNERYDSLLKKDIRFCCLVKIGFSFADMQYVLGCAPDTVYKRSQDLKRRMGVDQKEKLKDIIDQI